MRQVIITLLVTPLTIINAQTPQMGNGWPFITVNNDWNTLSVPHFETISNIPNSALYYCSQNRKIEKIHFNGLSFNGWPFLFDTLSYDRSPIVVDFDHDGESELITLGTKFSEDGSDQLYASLLAIDNNGLIMPGFPIIFQEVSHPNVADIDGDNEYEILLFSKDTWEIYCIDHLGNSKPGWPIEMPTDMRYSFAGAIADLDLDGMLEYIVSGYHGIYAYRFDGTTQPGYPFFAPDSFNFYNGGWPPTIADIDHDSYPEILTSCDNWYDFEHDYWSQIIVYEHDGTIKNGWPVVIPERCWINSAPIPSDINSDGEIEIEYCWGLYMTYVDMNGVPLPGWPAILQSGNAPGFPPNADVITVDINGDGYCEIFMDHNVLYPDSVGHDSITYYGYGLLYGLNYHGEILLGYPMPTFGVFFRMPPVFSRAPENHRLYMSMSSEINLEPIYPIDTTFVALYVFPDSTGPTNQWPMLSHDNLMTRNYNFIDRVTSIDDGDNVILPKSPTLAQNYPNPFNQSTLIEFTLPQQQQLALTIFDILGRKLFEIYNQEMSSGIHRVRLDRNLPSGLYFYALETSNTRIVRKMTVLK